MERDHCKPLKWKRVKKELFQKSKSMKYSQVKIKYDINDFRNPPK